MREYEETGRLMTKRQLAQRLNVSVSAVDRMLREGGLPHVKLQKAVRFRPDDIRQYVEARVRTRAAEG